MSRTRTMIWIAVFMVVGAFSVGLGTVRTVSALNEMDNDLKVMEVFADVYKVVREQYVDIDEASPEALLQGAIHGMLSALDPFSQYFPPKEYQNFQEQTKGQFGGLGIRIQIANEGWLPGWLTVVEPLPNTPAEKATAVFEKENLVGLEAGDKIIEISGKSTQDININDAVDQLKGVPGTSVTIRIARRKAGRVITPEFNITRDIITVPAVDPEDDVRIINGEIGYLRLREFSQAAAEELGRSLAKLEEKGIKALVLDLRSNTGGLLPVAVEVCQLFLPEGQVVVSIAERNRKREPYYCKGQPQPYMPMAVLVNEQSASASEIVAGALQDTGRAVIVGPRGKNTYGKGSVQNVINLRDGSGIKLTTAKYYTPSGRSIHEKGITPDVFVDIDDQHWINLQIAKRVAYLPANRMHGKLLEKDKPEGSKPEKGVKPRPVKDGEEFRNVCLPVNAPAHAATKEAESDKPTIDEILARADSKKEEEGIYDKELLMAAQVLDGKLVLDEAKTNKRSAHINGQKEKELGKEE